jgi:hypothetical protein
VSHITLFAKTNFRGEGKIFGLKKATPELHLTQKTILFGFKAPAASFSPDFELLDSILTSSTHMKQRRAIKYLLTQMSAEETKSV